MKRNFRSIAIFTLSALALWAVRVPSAMATNPTEVVIFVCQDFSPFNVVYYNHSASAPGQTSGAACSDQLEDLLTVGLTNVNVSVQNDVGMSSTSGIPNGTEGAYITYVLANGTLTSGGL